mmetsp:Transcript_81780/g.243920  ORF Transcript_81780/g.243920 Transcript_81780/m.243920 type:complete len:211 (+) Transcript_81780:1325-1957(+)
MSFCASPVCENAVRSSRMLAVVAGSCAKASIHAVRKVAKPLELFVLSGMSPSTANSSRTLSVERPPVTLGGECMKSRDAASMASTPASRDCATASGEALRARACAAQMASAASRADAALVEVALRLSASSMSASSSCARVFERSASWTWMSDRPPSRRAGLDSQVEAPGSHDGSWPTAVQKWRHASSCARSTPKVQLAFAATMLGLRSSA